MVAVLFAGVVGACTGRPEPVPLVLDEEMCSHCRMAVSQRPFAAEVVTVEGSVDYFDDIGCLVAWVKEHRPSETAGVFVVDYESEEWLDARGAYYVESKRLPTPMSSGLAAFGSEESAEAAAERLEGRVVLWADIHSRGGS